MRRLEEEPVERQHARDRNRQCQREPPPHGREQHREDVQRAEAEDGDPPVEDADRGGDERHRAGAREHADDDVCRVAAAAATRGHDGEGRRCLSLRPLTTVSH